jgi:hypothetical protein
MADSYILIKSERSYTELAYHVKSLLNVANQNRNEYARDQERDGLNRGGGEYYCFELLGLYIYLIRNKGEVQYFDEEWPFYLTIEFEEEIESEIFSGIVNYINFWLTKEGFATKIEKVL